MCMDALASALMDESTYLTPGQVARMWLVSEGTVRRLIRSGQLPAVETPTGRYRIRPVDAELQPVVPEGEQ